MVVCLEKGADLHTAQLMSLPLADSCFSRIQIGFTFLVPAHLGSPGKRAVKRVCVCVCVPGMLTDFETLVKQTYWCGQICIINSFMNTMLRELFFLEILHLKKNLAHALLSDLHISRSRISVVRSTHLFVIIDWMILC